MPNMPSGPQSHQVAKDSPPREEEVDRNRRDFFRIFAAAAAEVGLLAIGVRMLTRDTPAAENTSPGLANDYDWNEHFWAMLINVKKCIGCYSCM